MTTLLVKHTAEARDYVFDFTGTLPPGERRGNVWSSRLINEGDALSAPAVTATRDDGVASDLTIGAPTTDGQVVTVRLSGGTAAHVYRLACSCTVGTQTVRLEGLLAVGSELP